MASNLGSGRRSRVPAWFSETGLREADLAEIWRGQSFPAEALGLTDGRRLRVVLPGRPGRGPGPDFRDVLVEIDGEEHYGDVELHVEASAFRDHGHHRDPAYTGVVLHVVFWAGGETESPLVDGGRAPVAAFGPWLAGRSQELSSWLRGQRLWREPCSTAASRLGDTAIAGILRLEGEKRFERKIARMRESCAENGPELAIWRGLLDIIGRGGDREAWRLLSLCVGPADLRAAGPPEAAEDFLFARAGFGTGPHSATAAGSQGRSLGWQFSGRPQNAPERRLKALAALWRRATGDLPAYAVRSVRLAKSSGALAECWTVRQEGARQAVLGLAKAREVILNVVLPFAALEPALERRVVSLAASLPAALPYGRTSFLEDNLVRPQGGRRVRTALDQQGLLALQTDWCSRGGCGRCPLS